MVLQTSGMISFGNIVSELGLSSNSQLSISSLQMQQKLQDISTAYSPVSFSNFYGQTCLSNYFFRIINSSNMKTMLFDNEQNKIRLNALVSSTTKYINLNILQSNNAYSNSKVNFEGASVLQNINNTSLSNWISHSNLILNNINYNSTSSELSWHFIQVPTQSNQLYIYNSYNKTNANTLNGYFVGFSNNDDTITLTNDSNLFMKWSISPFMPSLIPLRPIVHAYANQAVNSIDLLPYYSNNSSVTKWGPFEQANTSIAPLFVTSGGYLNRPYVNFFWTARLYTTSNTMMMMSNNTLSNWLSNSTTPGVSFFILMNPRDTAANSGYMSVYLCNSNDDVFSCLRRNVTDSLRFNLWGTSYFVGGYNGSFPYQTWSLQAFRYNLITNTWNSYSTTSSNISTLSSIQSGAGTGTIGLSNFTLTSNMNSIGGANYYVDSLYVCDNWLDDITTLSTIRSIMSGGNIS